MQKEILNSKTPPELNRSVHALLLTFNLLSIFKKLQFMQNGFEGELNSMVLLNKPQKKIVLTALNENTEIDSFQSNDSLTLKVIWGKLKFQTWKESIIICKGQFYTMDQNLNYNLTTSERTVFMLTVKSSNRSNAKKNVYHNNSLN